MRTLSTVFFLLWTVGMTSAADIQKMAVTPEVTSVKMLSANQFVICDFCLTTSALTQIKTPVSAPAVAIRLTQSPMIVAKVEAPQQKAAREKSIEETRRLVVVNFRLGQYAVKGGEKAKIASAAGSLLAADKIRIKGYTCDLGSRAYNDRLAIKRAETVRRDLHSLGVADAKMEVSGEGLCCYASSERSKNRRVEVTEIRKKSAP
jgi:outer membrane protein OmpA-like peptidoglycan-associated protein